MVFIDTKSPRQIWGQWDRPYERSHHPEMPPNPFNLLEVLLDPITASDEARTRVSSIDPCNFVGLRKPSGRAQDPRPFQPPEIIWSFRFTRLVSWVYVGAETGQIKCRTGLDRGIDKTIGSGLVTNFIKLTTPK